MLVLLKALSEVESESGSQKKESNMSTISGLIIDAFGELRDQLDSVKENMESNCFICGIGKEYFDTVPHGFDTHVAQEHNLANYM
jgi:ryanodine receptor 2